MLRPLYVGLLRLHPARFRDRFAEEMVEIFDQTTGAGRSLRLVGDCAVSLARQWVFRSDFRRDVPVPACGGAEMQLFQSIEAYQPRPSALLQGGLIALLALGSVGVVIGKGGRMPPIFIGVHHPSPHLLGIDRASVAETDLTTTVTLGAAPEDPWRAVAAVYFKIVRVLDVLDADRDLIISPWEIITAPAALRKLDTDHDGTLSAQECGFSVGKAVRSSLSPESIERMRRAFMLGNPVLAALDENHDGEISADEIERSSQNLRRLDRNGDGSLTADELIPDQQAVEGAMFMVGLDTNGDGRISGAERRNADATTQALLDAADRNHDGIVTQAELAAELGFRAERKRQLERARRVAGFR